MFSSSIETLAYPNALTETPDTEKGMITRSEKDYFGPTSATSGAEPPFSGEQARKMFLKMALTGELTKEGD
jgi:hypothetical protein